MKEIGLLMPVFALPSKYGIGDFGEEAYGFIDVLSSNNLTLWNILPLCPVDSNNNCPYSTYAINSIEPLYISIDDLAKEGLLEYSDLVPYITEGKVNYKYAYDYKYKMFKKAFEKFKLNIPDDYQTFKLNNKWAYLFGVYSKFRNLYNDTWNYWDKTALEYFNNKFIDDDTEFYIFLQYIAYKQWNNIKAYANERNIKIIGDIPIYLDYNSADVWAEKDNFLLNNGKMEYCSGTSPDYFNSNGQKWGHPLYNFDYMEKDNYKYMLERFDFANSLYDIVRIDHFRAFDTYYKIPIDSNAWLGKYELGPREKLLDKLFSKYESSKFIVEDLGDLRKETYELRDKYNLTGMKILEYTLFGKKDQFLDNNNLIVYTGNHDNMTINGWYDNLDIYSKSDIDSYLANTLGKTFSEKVIRYIVNLNHKYIVLPIQDILCLDNSAIWNVPGKVSCDNFTFKIEDYTELNNRLREIKKYIE
jgi:4-alpha-glucanotransferase